MLLFYSGVTLLLIVDVAPLSRYQFVTLLGVLRFHAKSLLLQLALVESIEGELEANAPQALGRAASQLKELGLRLGLLGFPHLERRTQRVFDLWKEKSLTLEVALHESREVRRAFLEELDAHLYFVVPAGDRDLYEKPPLNRATASAFPAADEELQLAGKCLALDQQTAAVFHAMRALEVGLSAFARQLEVPPPERPMWGPIIDRIEAAINSARQARLTSERRALLDTYADAATHFRFLKDAWRNHTMHQRQNYDRARSQNILQHVSQFLEQLAEADVKE